jgi:hypothetical protein
VSANGTSPALAIPLPDEWLEELAQRVAAILAERQETQPECWLSVEAAALHLSISTSTVYSLCAARRTNGFPVVKEGARSYFRASELDAWRRRERPAASRPTHARIERL